jgi:hypothetical protein
MSVTEIRKEVHKYVDEIDEKALQGIFAFMKSYTQKNEETTVGYTASGEALTREKVIQRARAASKRVKSGQFTTHEDVMKQSESW